MLLVLGIVMGVLAVLALIGGDIIGLLIDGAISGCTFAFGYAPLQKNNVPPARTVSLVCAIVLGIFAIITIIILASAGAFAGIFIIALLIMLAVIGGYAFAYTRLTPKRG